MITQDDTMFFNDVAMCSAGSGAVVLDTAVRKTMAEALGNKKALFIKTMALLLQAKALILQCGGS